MELPLRRFLTALLILAVELTILRAVHCEDSDLHLSSSPVISHRKLAEKHGLSDGSYVKRGAFLVIGGGIALLACVSICPCLQAKRKEEKHVEAPKPKSVSEPSYYTPPVSLQQGSSLSPLHPSMKVGCTGALTFTMAELNRITGNFSSSNKIGGGSSGMIYKGKLRDGSLVAVKRAKKDSFEARHTLEFQNEVNMLSNIEHLNLVKLVGYLEDERERIIVVEYVPNGNLRQHLDGEYSVLDFSTRLDIAIDVAHALTYLHLYADQPIIHRDVKTTNILLTDTCRAKVADFGFSRAGPSDVGATHVSTQVKGTAGYLDPEYLQTYQLTTKSDVYSFGILLIEIFSGRRPIELSRPSDERISIRWAFKKFVEGKIDEMLDPQLPKNATVISILEKLAEVAFKCAAPSRRERPTMKEAAELLWNIRREYQASISQSTTPTIESRLQSPRLQSPLHTMERSPRHSPMHIMEKSPRYKHHK